MCWDGAVWDGLAGWDGAGRDWVRRASTVLSVQMGWDGIGYNGMGCHGTGRDGTGRGGTGWNGIDCDADRTECFGLGCGGVG